MNTLYVLTQGARVSKDQKNIVVRKDQEELLRVPIHHVNSIVTFGLVRVTPGLMGECLEKGVELSFMSLHGRFLGRIDGISASGTALRRAQYRLSGSAEALPLAVSMIRGKITNQRAVLFRHSKEGLHYEVSNQAVEAAARLGHLIDRLAGVRDFAQLMALEGQAAAIYLPILGSLPQNHFFEFKERSRRPPKDPGNALLSFYYSLLLSDVLSALRAAGLDPGAGLLHADRPGRPSLALDLMEEFRPALADRAFLGAVNQKAVVPEDVHAQEGEGFRMTEEGRKKAVSYYRHTKEEQVSHQGAASAVSLNQIPHVQASLLAGSIRSRSMEYQPFQIR